MECPKCRKEVSDSDLSCPYCGTKIRSAPENGKKRVRVKPKKAEDKSEKKRRAFFGRKKSKEDTAVKAEKKERFGKKLKTAAVVVCAAAVVIVAGTVVSSVLSDKGEKYAETAAEYIGSQLSRLEGSEDMHFTDESEFFGVNSAVAFDYVMESEKKISSQGISYPSWAVFLKTGDGGKISDVTYTDFSVVEGDPRGERNDTLIDLDSFDKGAKQTKVLNFIDIEPYSITYSQSGMTVYTYKYYFTRDNGDEQQAILRAAFDGDGEYRYYVSELIFPENM